MLKIRYCDDYFLSPALLLHLTPMSRSEADLKEKLNHSILTLQYYEMYYLEKTERISNRYLVENFVFLNVINTIWQILVPECYASINVGTNSTLSVDLDSYISLEQAIEAIKDGSWLEKNIILHTVSTNKPETGTGFFCVQMEFCFLSDRNYFG